MKVSRMIVIFFSLIACKKYCVLFKLEATFLLEGTGHVTPYIMSSDVYVQKTKGASLTLL